MPFTHTHTHTDKWCERQQEATFRKVKRCLQAYLNFGSSSRHFRDVAHDVFGRHRLPGAALATANRLQSVTTRCTRAITERESERESEHKGGSPNDDALVLSIDHHVSVHVIGQGVDVRWILVLGLHTKAKVSAAGGSFVPREGEDSQLPGRVRSPGQ